MVTQDWENIKQSIFNDPLHTLELVFGYNKQRAGGKLPLSLSN